MEKDPEFCHKYAMLKNEFIRKYRLITLSLLLSIAWLFAPTLTQAQNQRQQVNQTLPSVHDTNGILSRAKENAIGQAWLQHVEPQLAIWHDALIQDYILKLIYDLSVATGLSGYDFRLLFIDDKRINAFAVPGGIIGINSGLMIYADTLDQFVSVLAHELGHLKQKHFLRNLEYLESTKQQDLTALLLGIGFFITGHTPIGFATIYGNAAAKQDQVLAYSRDFETEADLLALETMESENYNPFAMTALLDKLQQDANNSWVLPEFLSTHPITRNRIALIQERLIHKQPAPDKTNLNYQLLRSRIIAESGINQENFVSTEVKSYYHALTTTKKQEAISALQTLLSARPDNLIYIISLAEAWMDNQQPDQAITLLNKHQSLNPQNYPLNTSLVQAYQQEGKLIAARELLESLTKSHPRSTWLWQKLAEISQTPDAALSFHIAKANVFALKGQINLAIKQFNLAKPHAKSVIEKAKINQSIKFYQEMQEENKDKGKTKNKFS